MKKQPYMDNDALTNSVDFDTLMEKFEPLNMISTVVLQDIIDELQHEIDDRVPKADLTIGSSGRHYYDEPETPEDRQCRLEALQEFAEDEAMLAQPRVNFPDQGHKVRGGFKEGTGEITPPDETHLTEWNEHD